MFDKDEIAAGLGNVDMAPGSGGNNPNKWQKVKAMEIDIGSQIIMRIPPRDPSKCPHGYFPHLNHDVQFSQTEKSMRVLCGRTGSLKNSCTLCDTITALEGLKGEINPDVLKLLPEYKAKGDILIPFVGYLECYSEEDAEYNGFKYKKRKWRACSAKDPDDEKGYILQMKLGPLYTENFLLTQLSQVTAEDTREDAKGQLYKLVRSAQYQFNLVPTGKRMGMRNLDVLEHFPNFPGYGKDQKKSDIELEALLEDCYWWKYVEKFIEFDPAPDMSRMAVDEDIDWDSL